MGGQGWTGVGPMTGTVYRTQEPHFTLQPMGKWDWEEDVLPTAWRERRSSMSSKASMSADGRQAGGEGEAWRLDGSLRVWCEEGRSRLRGAEQRKQ